MEKAGDVVLLQEAVAGKKDYIEACLHEDVAVVCINRESKGHKKMPFHALYDSDSQFWLKNETWEYFLSAEDLSQLKEAVARKELMDKIRFASESEPEKKADEPGTVAESGFGSAYESIVAMTGAERVQHLKEHTKRLGSLIAQKPRQQALITEALVDTTQDTILHNHAAITGDLLLTDEEAKKENQPLVDATQALVQFSTKLITADIFNDDLMNTLVAKSNGTVIQHMIRVYLNGLAFLSYYNNLVTSTNLISKLRISLDEEHKNFYQKLMPDHLISLEKIFCGGMRAIPDKYFLNWATGFLIHDIGKAASIEYHESEKGYNRDIVMEHIKIGYTAIMNKTNYPIEAGFISGYHHEYYGDPEGYGYYRISLDKHKKTNPQTKYHFCIAYDYEPMQKFDALAYFPAKILEIIDVFDSITDPNRKYRTAMEPNEALGVMHDEFIVKHPKIDLILFNIFSKFIKEKAQ